MAPDPLAGWTPTEVGSQLGRSNFRWGLATFLTLLVAGLAFFGLWLYQRPNRQAESAMTDLHTQAASLESQLDGLANINDDLLSPTISADTAALLAVESNARTLFQISAALPTAQTEMRSAASDAAGTAMDASRLLGGAISYGQAVLPTLVSPELETDPALIELDEAARAFGDWQLHFDNVRTALPSGILSEVTVQLDVLSRDLSTMLTSYIDALREEDQAGVTALVADLGGRLGQVEESLDTALVSVQELVTTRIEDARRALGSLLG